MCRVIRVYRSRVGAALTVVRGHCFRFLFFSYWLLSWKKILTESVTASSLYWVCERSSLDPICFSVDVAKKIIYIFTMQAFSFPYYLPAGSFSVILFLYYSGEGGGAGIRFLVSVTYPSYLVYFSFTSLFHTLRQGALGLAKHFRAFPCLRCNYICGASKLLPLFSLRK